MFQITEKKGFRITFKNGWTVSVQFGHTNYCDHYRKTYDTDEKLAADGSMTAECAVLKDGEMVEHPMGGTIGAYMTPKEVLELMNWVSRQ